jgi:hypothetical protein
MFVAAYALVVAGCAQKHILRMSSPEQSTTVALFDQGEEDGTDDDTVIVLDDPARIADVTAFFKARVEKWKLLDGKPPRNRRYQISFRRWEEVTDRFWLEGRTLGLHTPSGDDFICDLSGAECAELLETFRFTTNFKSYK